MNPPQPPSPSGPPASRFVAIWVPDWPVVALTMEARQRHRHPNSTPLNTSQINGKGMPS